MSSNTVAGGLEVLFNDPRGVPRDHRSPGDVSSDDAGRGDDAVVADRDAWKNDRVRADEAVVADAHVAIDAIDEVVREDGAPERHDGVSADVDAARIRFIQLRAQRNRGPFADVHFPHVNEVLSAQEQHLLAQRVPNSRR